MPTDDVVLELQGIPGSEFTCRVPMTLPAELYGRLEARYDKDANVDGMPCPLCNDAYDATCSMRTPIPTSQHSVCALCPFVKALWDAGVPDDELSGPRPCVRLLPRSCRKADSAAFRNEGQRSTEDEAAMDEALRVLHSITVKNPAE